MADPKPIGPRPNPERPELDRLTSARCRALDAAMSFADPVEGWKASVRERIAEEERARDRRPGIQIHVTLGFVALAAVVGSFRGPTGWVMTLVTLGSVLAVHETARALLARALGRSSAIRISAASGETELSGPPLRGLAAVAFTTIGSLSNVLVALTAIWVDRHGLQPGVSSFVRAFAFSHALWGGLQLLPLVPFRTGMAISTRLAATPRFMHAAASFGLVVTMGVLAVNATKAPVLLGVVVFVGLACANAVRDAHQESADAHTRVDAILAEADAALAAGDAERAAGLARHGLGVALSGRQRQRLWKTLAWAGIGKRDPFVAHEAMLRVRPEAIDLHLLASYLSACNRVDEAVDLLEGMRGVGHRSPETTRLLADLLFRRGQHRALLALARADEELLSVDELRAIETALVQAVSPTVS